MSNYVRDVVNVCLCGLLMAADSDTVLAGESFSCVDQIDVFGIRLGGELEGWEGIGCQDRDWGSARNVTVSLREPIFGLSTADVSCDFSNRVYEISLHGAFRRGLAREVSLDKLKSLRAKISSCVGFDIGEYKFSTSSCGVGVPFSKGGDRVWLDMDSVYAECLVTNRDVFVKLKCAVNPPQIPLARHSRKKSRFSRHMDDAMVNVVEHDCCDSRIDFAVTIANVSLKESEDRRRSLMTEEVRRRQEEASRREQQKLTEMFGIRFDVPTDFSAKKVSRKDYEELTIQEGRTNRYVKSYWVNIDREIKPKEYFDFARVVYSYESRITQMVDLYGHFPANTSSREVISVLDEFADEVSNMCGVEFSENLVPCGGQEIRGPGCFSLPLGYDECQYDILPEYCYYCRECQNHNMFIRLVAGSTTKGVRSVVLQIHNFNTSIGSR